MNYGQEKIVNVSHPLTKLIKVSMCWKITNQENKTKI